MSDIDVWERRKAKRQKKVGLFSKEHRQAIAERRKLNRRVKDNDRTVQRLDKIPAARRTDAEQKKLDDARADRERAQKALLAAQHDVDEARDSLRHWKGLLARAVKKLAQLRKPKAGKVYSRSEWGARPPRGSYSRNAAIHTQVLHHTAGPTPSASNTAAQDAEHMRWLQNLHFANGWSDIGYHRVVMPSGRIFEGRPSWAIGAHVLGHNTGTVGVSCAGNYESATPSRALLAGAARALGGLPGSGARLVGHFQLGQTACPGKNLKPKIGEIASRR